MSITPHGTIDLGFLFSQEEVRRKQGVASPETREQLLLRTLRDTPVKLMEDKELYKEFMESFFYIRPKGRGLDRFTMNNSQDILLDAYFIMKSETPFTRINILKGRQQGMSTLIGAFAVMEMLIHPTTGALIATENKDWSGKNLYQMYDLYLSEFQKQMQDHLRGEPLLWDGDITGRFSYGNECFLANHSFFNVVGETNVTSKTLQFIHLSEAAFYHHLDTCLGMMLQTLPKEQSTKSAMFIETTAKMYGNQHHEGWEASCEGKSAFYPLFIPWYIHEEYAFSFKSDEEKEKFVASLGESDDDEFGNEKAILATDNSAAPWRKLWDDLDFASYGYDNVTYENLKFRRYTIRELKGDIAEFNRQYPTIPEDAFLSKSAHVLDMDAIRWYLREQVKDPKMRGILKKVGFQRSEFQPMRNGILAVWEGPVPYREYIIGVDTAEGFDTGDYSCAYVISRNPFRIVARLRGTEGRSININELVQQLCLLGFMYNNAWMCIENNSGGEAVTQLIAREGYPFQIREGQITGNNASGRFGWRSTKGAGGTRERGVGLLQESIVDKTIGIPCQEILNETFHFHYVNGRAQAARKGLGGVGSHDDCILALIGALLANERLPQAKSEMELREEQAKLQDQMANKNIERNTKSYTDYKRFI